MHCDVTIHGIMYIKIHLLHLCLLIAVVVLHLLSTQHSSVIFNLIFSIQGYIDVEGKVVPKTYCMFYAGDYDSAAWLYSQLKSNWDDPNRGKVSTGRTHHIAVLP